MKTNPTMQAEAVLPTRPVSENGKINIYLRTGKDMNAPCPLQHYFEIIIEDSGIGIDPAEIGRILLTMLVFPSQSYVLSC